MNASDISMDLYRHKTIKNWQKYGEVQSTANRKQPNCVKEEV